MRVTKHKFKTEEVAMTFLSLEPTLIFVIAHMLKWCDQRSLPFVITSAVREFETGQVSTTHPDGRAIDVSVRDWQADQIELFVKEWNESEMNRKFGAVSRDGTANLVVYHKVAGGEYHFHIQCRREV